MTNEDLTRRTLLAPAFLPDSEAVEASAPPETDAVEDRPEGPSVAKEQRPPGEGLAELLAEGLKRRGWAVDYHWTTYDGHAFDAKRKDIRYDVEVRCLDAREPDEDLEDTGRGLWLVTAKRRTGFFKNFFQGRSDPAEHALLRLHIDESLAGDPRTVEAAATMTPWTTEREAGLNGALG